MTAKQAEVWALYASGHRVCDIASALGRSKGTVSTTIKKIKEAIATPKAKDIRSITCPYSSSCFSCPLSDCGIDSTKAGRFNVLPGDLYEMR